MTRKEEKEGEREREREYERASEREREYRREKYGEKRRLVLECKRIKSTTMLTFRSFPRQRASVSFRRSPSSNRRSRETTNVTGALSLETLLSSVGEPSSFPKEASSVWPWSFLPDIFSFQRIAKREKRETGSGERKVEEQLRNGSKDNGQD